VEICLGLAIAVPTFIFGARQAYGQLALAILVLVAFALWISAKIRQGPVLVSLRQPEGWLPLAAIALSLVTWIPFSASWIRTLSPAIGRLLPDWGTFGAADGWHTFSLTPGLSRDGTFLFILYGLLFWITLDTVRRSDAVYRLLGFLFVTGVGVAALGLLHYLFWNGKFYWLWEIWWVEPDRQVRAPFTNRNHFAGFLALTIGPGVAWFVRVVRDWKNHRYSSPGAARRPSRAQEIKILAIAGGLTLILAGMLLAQSRAGMMVGLMAAAVCIAGIIHLPPSHALADRTWFGSRLRSGAAARRGPKGWLVAVGVIVLTTLALTVTFARQNPFQRTAQMLNGNQSLDEILSDRLMLWEADLAAVRDFPLLGTGPGSHQYVYPLYLDKGYRTTFTHAENGYIQVLMECGLVGALLLAAALFFLFRWSWRATQHGGRQRSHSASGAAFAVVASLLAALIHATVDFVWYVPAYAATVAVLAGMIRSLARSSRIEDRRSSIDKPGKANAESIRNSRSSNLEPRSSPALRWIWGVTLAPASVVLIGMIGERFVQAAQTEYAWNAYYRLARDDAEGSTSSSTVEERIRWLTAACDHGSTDPDHYLRLGLANLEIFLQKRKQAANPAGLLQTRKILQQGRFADADNAGAWLRNRYGDDLVLLERAHAALDGSLACCPLLGETYLHLAKLCFLDDPVGPQPEVYWQQAERVRPNDPDIYLQIGLEHWLAGDADGARTSWQRACALLPSCQSRLLPLLADQLPVQRVVEFLLLDFEGLRWLTLAELEKGRTEAAAFAARKAQEAIERNPAQAKNPAFWIVTHELYQKVGLPIQAEACLRKALCLTPDQLGIFVLLIRSLMEQGKWREALAQAQDARQQFPDKSDVQALVNDILAMKVPWARAAGDRQKSMLEEQKLAPDGARSSIFRGGVAPKGR
jgi:O-antigen ligase/tetratricopeptide (TPR) repeat protein